MKNIDKFNDFQLDILFENIEVRSSVNELPFVLSNELIELLKKVNHTISTELLLLGDKHEDNKVTLIDIDNDIYSKDEKPEVYYKRFTLINSNKVFGNILAHYGLPIDDTEKPYKNEDVVRKFIKSYKIDTNVKYDIPFLNKNRVSIKIGSFIKKVFGDKFKDGGDPGNDIETFVNSIVAYRKSKSEKKVGTKEFKLVQGQNIVKYYNESNYDGETGPLHGSCMRYESCEDYIQFYAYSSSISLLVLTSADDADLIVGRALVWDLETPSGRTFMDRIYTVHDDDVELFKMYATEHGWLYKRKQNMNTNEQIVDSINGKERNMILVSKNTMTYTDDYPYMDTLAYFNIEKRYCSNDSNYIEERSDEYYLILKDTDGGYAELVDVEERQYVEYYNERVNVDDLTWCEYGDDWRKDGDYEELGDYYNNEYATNTYRDSEMVWSEYENGYLVIDDTVESSYHDTSILEETSIDVFDDAHFNTFEESLESPTDYRHEDEIDESVITYISKKLEKCYYDMEKNDDVFLECIMYNTNTFCWKHKIWDKKNIVPIKGEKKLGVDYYYVHDIKDNDDLIGQTRLFDNKQNNFKHN